MHNSCGLSQRMALAQRAGSRRVLIYPEANKEVLMSIRPTNKSWVMICFLIFLATSIKWAGYGIWRWFEAAYSRYAGGDVCSGWGWNISTTGKRLHTSDNSLCVPRRELVISTDKSFASCGFVQLGVLKRVIAINENSHYDKSTERIFINPKVASMTIYLHRTRYLNNCNHRY